MRGRAMNKGEWIKGVAHWREGGVAMISVAFTWRLPDARDLAVYYDSIGMVVRIGGPALFTKKARDYMEGYGDVVNPKESPGRVQSPDAVSRHNPMATFASRGCPLGCSFCIVTPMEGAGFTEFDNFAVRPVLCDNNLSALDPKFQDHIVNRYLREDVPLLDANSGFEPTTFDDEVFRRWSPILKGPWRFGYDESGEGAAVERVMRMLRDVSPRRKQVYTMIGHEPFDVCMERIQRVIDWGGEPYAQPFMQLNALEKRAKVRHDWTEMKLRRVARWVNRHIWRKTPDFADYRPSAKTAKAIDETWEGTLFDVSS